jgi:hypothetical protein
MAKKEHDPVKALKKAFQSEVEDLELQERYNRFQEHLEHAKKLHNELVQEVNPLIDQINSLRDAITSQAILGIIATEAISKLKELEAKVKGIVENIEVHKESIDYNKKLMESYQRSSDAKMFVWYQALKAVDPETPSFLEWRETYKNRII